MKNDDHEERTKQQKGCAEIGNRELLAPQVSHLEEAVVEQGEAHGVIEYAKAACKEPASWIARTQHVG